jgi:transcriptional regulator with XRE-family HTH domain
VCFFCPILKKLSPYGRLGTHVNKERIGGIAMDTKAVGERIQIAREERCITQRDLANIVGCTPQHISAIERGAKTPTLETFARIAAALQVPADVLLQDVLPDWWDTWEQEIDRVLAPLLPHVRSYLKKQILEYHQMEETCAYLGQRLPQR